MNMKNLQSTTAVSTIFLTLLLVSGCSDGINHSGQSVPETALSTAEINPVPAFLQRGCAESTVDLVDCPG